MLKKGGNKAIISNQASEVANATKIILPGMGHFDQCMKQFNASGLRELIEKKAFVEKVPVLGICVGLQMMMRSSEEGTEPGLAWVKGDTIRFRTSEMDTQLKVPNMGWLEVKAQKESKLLRQIHEARFYFAHSYHVKTDQQENNLLTARYGYDIVVAIEHENLFGVQFHPEKSHRFGLQLLKNFAEL